MCHHSGHFYLFSLPKATSTYSNESLQSFFEEREKIYQARLRHVEEQCRKIRQDQPRNGSITSISKKTI